MRPTTADCILDYRALLHPGTRFEHPEEVVRHAGLTTAEKRAILASWASDASANVLPLSALSRGTEEPGVHRRDTRSLVPTGQRLAEPVWREARSIVLNRASRRRVTPN